MKAVFVAGGTGGHIFPALAVAREYKKIGTDIYWIGRKNSLEQKISLEEDFFFEAVKTKGFRGKGLLEKLFSIFSLISSLVSSARILKKLNPDFIFSCGGFTSLGPGMVSYFLKIPLFIHEQNSVAGSANRLLSNISLKTFEGFPSSFKKMSGVEFVGNPVRDEVTRFMEEESSLKGDKKKFHLLILGGSQGSKQLNSIVMNCLEQVEEKKCWKIIHQTGKADKSRLEKFYSNSNSDFKVEAFIKNIGKAYKNADLVISRAGAMTITELMAMGKPSILLPLPWATDNHQLLNAAYLKEIGAAEVISSDEKNSQKLKDLLSDLAKNKEKRLSMSNSAKLSFVPGVAKQIFNKINESVKAKS